MIRPKKNKRRYFRTSRTPFRGPDYSNRSYGGRVFIRVSCPTDKPYPWMTTEVSLGEDII